MESQIFFFFYGHNRYWVAKSVGHTCKLTSGANYVGITLKSGVMHVHVYKVISTTKLSPRCWAVESLTRTQLSAVTIPSLAYLCTHSLQIVSCLLYIHMAFWHISVLPMPHSNQAKDILLLSVFRYIQHFCMLTHTCICALTTHEDYDLSKDSHTKRRYSLETSIG